MENVDLPLLIDDTQVPTDLSIDEIVKLAAIDNEFFNRTFFPKTFRQPSPLFHRQIDRALDSPQHTFLNLQCYRGSAKTTKLRAFVCQQPSRALTVIGQIMSDCGRG